MAMAPGDPSLIMGAFGKIMLFALIAAVIFYGVSMLIWRGGMVPGEAPNFAWAFHAGPALAFCMMVIMIAAYIVIFIVRSEEHTSELQSLMRNSYALFFLKQQTIPN